MSTLIIIAMAVFMNGITGEVTTVMEPETSLQECVEVLNDHHVVQTEDGETWYMVKAACRVGVVSHGEIVSVSPLPENWK